LQKNFPNGTEDKKLVNHCLAVSRSKLIGFYDCRK